MCSGLHPRRHELSSVAPTPPPTTRTTWARPSTPRWTDICRNVMGLSPAERLSGGNWLGNSRLDYRTSYYRGCVLSLSDSLSRSVDAGIVQQADADCRSKGYRSGTPDLALCVLNTAKRPRRRGPAPGRSSGGDACQRDRTAGRYILQSIPRARPRDANNSRARRSDWIRLTQPSTVA